MHPICPADVVECELTRHNHIFLAELGTLGPKDIILVMMILIVGSWTPLIKLLQSATCSSNNMKFLLSASPNEHSTASMKHFYEGIS